MTSSSNVSSEHEEKLTPAILCVILSFLSAVELRKCRLISRQFNDIIESHFVLEAPLNDENLGRRWRPHVQLLWLSQRMKRKGSSAIKVPARSEKGKVQNRKLALQVGEVHQKFSLNPVASTIITEIEFSAPISKPNARKIVKDCPACTILRFHTSAFLGAPPRACCTRKSSLQYREIEIEAWQLRKLFLIFDRATMDESHSCTVPYSLKIHLPPPVESIQEKPCDIHFVTEGSDEKSLEIFKTWVISDRIIDLFSRPDCLRKLTYFARVTEAELRTIKIKFLSDLSVPGTVKCSRIIHQPSFYPQMRNYPTGPFNGAVLTYWLTKRKRIKTYRPVHISADVLFMSFPQAAMVLVSEIPPTLSHPQSTTQTQTSTSPSPPPNPKI